MNTIDQQQLDRLVDGELGDDDRERLIELFDQQADGWRQCACAFLEAQEFKSALGGGFELIEASNLSAMVSIPNEVAVTRKNASPRIDRSSTFLWWAALASCLVIGFGIGQFGSNADSGGGFTSPPAMIVGDSPDNGSPTEPGQLLASDDRGAVSTSDMPGESILERRYSAVPADIEDIFTRLGQRVERREVFMPLQSRDGGRGSVPMEEIEIVPVRWETY